MTQTSAQLNIDAVRQRVVQAAERAGRDPAEVTIMGASKQVEPERVLQVIAAGISHVGENQVQEADEKFNHPGFSESRVTRHLIGHLQTNKARRAVELFDVIQSVDSPRLAKRLDQIAGEMNRRLPVYIEVNIGLEESKNGIAPDSLTEFATMLAGCENLELEGLMTVPPESEDPEGARPYFRMLRELRDGLEQLEPFQGRILKLSMGMSHDFEVAIEEGATMVRLGRILWGSRVV